MRVWSSCRLLPAALVAFAALSLATPASAIITQTFIDENPIRGGMNPGFIANYRAVFTFDETCVGTDPVFCGLRITLSYDTTSGVPSQGEALTGLLFEPQGTANFQDGPMGNVPFGGVVGATTLVGNGNLIAAAELGNVTIGPDNYTVRDPLKGS